MDTNRIENQLWQVDKELFSKMENDYSSNAEKTFFETLHFKMEHEYTSSYELLLDSSENDDNLYFIRVDYDEFIVGHCGLNQKDDYIHTMSLSDALNVCLEHWISREIHFF